MDHNVYNLHDWTRWAGLIGAHSVRDRQIRVSSPCSHALGRMHCGPRLELRAAGHYHGWSYFARGLDAVVVGVAYAPGLNLPFPAPAVGMDAVGAHRHFRSPMFPAHEHGHDAARGRVSEPVDCGTRILRLPPQAFLADLCLLMMIPWMKDATLRVIWEGPKLEVPASHLRAGFFQFAQQR